MVNREMISPSTYAGSTTICAISTPAGVGGIAVARVSGPRAFEIVDNIWRGKPLATAASHTAHLGTVYDPATGLDLDQCVATIFRSPRSFTGEDIVEISVHGSPWIQRELIKLLVASGAEPASAGEFTRRAFVNGRLDLAEAEAVADMIASNSRASHHVAMSQMKGHFSRKLDDMRQQLLELASLLELELDFSEEEVEFASREKLVRLASSLLAMVQNLANSFAAGSAIKEGVPIAIVGETNAGKSTLLNRLLGEDRAIVSDIHGTTRDAIEETLEIGGVNFRFADTAGLRSTDDPIEKMGIERSLRHVAAARIVVWVIDPTAELHSMEKTASSIAEAVSSETDVVAVFNKSDLGFDTDAARRIVADYFPQAPIVDISALDNFGIEHLRQTIVDQSGIKAAIDANETIVTNARHYHALDQAAQSLRRVVDGLAGGISGDFVAQDLRESLHHLGEITGTISTPDILATIFSRFCIGK